VPGSVAVTAVVLAKNFLIIMKDGKLHKNLVGPDKAKPEQASRSLRAGAAEAWLHRPVLKFPAVWQPLLNEAIPRSETLSQSKTVRRRAYRGWIIIVLSYSG
jgi:hypothetical protein